jgi:hypothetical protein
MRIAVEKKELGVLGRENKGKFAQRSAMHVATRRNAAGGEPTNNPENPAEPGEHKNQSELLRRKTAVGFVRTCPQNRSHQITTNTHTQN